MPLLLPVLHVAERVGVQQQVPVQLQGFPKSHLGPLPEPEEALFLEGLILEQGFQPLIVPGAFQKVQVADVLGTKDSEWPRSPARRTPGWEARL